MKKTVLAFYGILMGMTIFLMVFQIARYGNITGSIGSEAEKAGLVNDKGYALSIFEPSKMLVYAGGGKTVYLEILNSGTTSLKECSIKGEGDLGFWIVADRIINLKPSESASYSFSVKVPENVQAGNYAIPFSLICTDYWRKGIMELEVLNDGNSLGNSKFSSALTGLSSADIEPSESGLIGFFIIALIVVVLTGLYLWKKQKRIENLSSVHDYKRRLIKLDLKN